MSYLSIQAQSILNELFPANPHRRVFSEQYVKYKGTRLFFDFYVKELRVYIECQGRQHFNYVKHFHGSKDNFFNAKYRDNLKIEYIQSQDFYLVHLNYDEVITKELVLQKINSAFESEYNFCE